MLLIGGLFLLALVFLVWKIMAPAQIYSRFGVSAATHKLLSTDPVSYTHLTLPTSDLV